MASIYELNKDYAELSAMLEAAETPEEVEAIKNTLEMLDLSIEEKIEIVRAELKEKAMEARLEAEAIDIIRAVLTARQRAD